MALQRLGKGCGDLWGAFSRTKTVDVQNLQETELKRCLSVFDLTLLGVGSTLGTGIYILIGEVARTQAGPAVVISFLIAAVASLLAGICYAEFAARVPRAGSAYIYSYVSVGELWAFVIGWNLLLENMIGAASSAKAWSQYLDAMFNDTIQKHITENVGSFTSPALGSFPDFMAFTFLILVTIFLSLGVKMSSLVNSCLTAVNVLVIVIIVIVGMFYVDGHNWTDPPGFFPFGVKGVISGAATCFYAFVGFDVIATSGEEARRPTHSIPTAIVGTLVICFLAYFGVSGVLTLIVPWNTLSSTAALPKAFEVVGATGAQYVIAVGGICGLVASMLGSLFPIPRIVYSMAQDGLLFRSLGTIHPRTNTPFLATWITGIVVAICALLLDLDSLIQMMSIGTLMAYTLVAISVIILRYQREHVGLTASDIHQDLDSAESHSEVFATTPDHDIGDDHQLKHKGARLIKQISGDVGLINMGEGQNIPHRGEKNDNITRQQSSDDPLVRKDKEILGRMAHYMSTNDHPPGSTYQRLDSNYSLNSLSQLLGFGSDALNEPTEVTRRIAVLSLTGLIIFWVALASIPVFAADSLGAATWWSVLLVAVCGTAVLTFTIVIARQPTNQARLNFKVPFVPLIPILSVLINIYLMLCLSPATWLRFLVWMTLGFLIYFGYGIHNSSERTKCQENDVILYDISDRDNILK